jgi:hypothetical protein
MNWLISRYFVSKEVAIKPIKVSRLELLSTARELLRFGAPFTASLLFGMGVQFVLPVLILNALDHGPGLLPTYFSDCRPQQTQRNR